MIVFRRAAPALLAAALGLAATLATPPAAAQTLTPPPEEAPRPAPVAPAEPALTSSCYAFAQRMGPGWDVRFARYAPELGENTVALTYVHHATFAIETPEGVTVATDFSGFAGRLVTPLIVTMNGAHSSHFTNIVPRGVEHVLRGWRDDQRPAGHDLTVKDLRVRSVSTNLRSRYGVRALNGNSIFVFEVADLCIGHLGHLHHEPTSEMYGKIGFLDIVLAPVDGGYTMSHADMITVLTNLRASVVIPMHYFSLSGLERFAQALSSDYTPTRADGSTVTFTRETLPKEPTLLMVPPSIGLDSYD